MEGLRLDLGFLTFLPLPLPALDFFIADDEVQLFVTRETLTFFMLFTDFVGFVSLLTPFFSFVAFMSLFTP